VKRVLSKTPVAVFFALVILLVSTFAIPCVQAQAAESDPECWAVIVGVSDYQYINDLHYCDDDALELTAAFLPVWGVGHIKCLVDSQATKANILDAIDWLADNADADDTVLFSFSGHGDNYLNGYFYTYNSLTTSYTNDISSSELASAFRQVHAGKTAIILDICYAGTFQNNLANNGRVIMMACRSNEESEESRILSNGVFTYYILQAIDNFGDADTNHDYELSAEEIAAYAYTRTYQFENSQHPVTDDHYSGQLSLLAQFVFVSNVTLPHGTNIFTLDGRNFTSVPVPLFWIPGSTHTITVSPIVDNGWGTRFVFVDWGDGNTSTTRLISKGSYTANYGKEQRLKIVSSFGDIQGAGWYKDGSVATFSIQSYIETSDTRHYFTGWSGEYSGTSPSVTLVMDAPKTETANWRNEYLLTVNSPYGSPSGAGWYQEGSTATFSVTPYVETPDSKHFFVEWSGDYSGTMSSASLDINVPKTVTANWRSEYLLTVNSDYGQPTGAGWYKEGEMANVSVEPEQGFIIRHIFTGWSGDLTDANPNSSLTVTSPKVVTATWKADYMQLYIAIAILLVVAGAIIVTVVLVRRKSKKTI
jgi:hypothetical protein